jgi:hypothetical protein
MHALIHPHSAEADDTQDTLLVVLLIAVANAVLSSSRSAEIFPRLGEAVLLPPRLVDRLAATFPWMAEASTLCRIQTLLAMKSIQDEPADIYEKSRGF